MTGSSDRYYGYGPISTTCTSVITTLFSPAPSVPASPSRVLSSTGRSGYPSPPSSSHSSPQIGAAAGTACKNQWRAEAGAETPPQSPVEPLQLDGKVVPPLMDFIAYALYRTRLPTCIIYSSLLLLTRLKNLYPSARGTASSPHRLFLSALMLASKMSMDDTYSNKSWCIVGQQLFTLPEINRMERELFSFLNWNCSITREELKAWTAEWVPSSTSAPAKAIASSRRSTSSQQPSGRGSASQAAAAGEAATRHRQASDAARALLRPLSGPLSSTAAQKPSSRVGPPSPPSPEFSVASSSHYRRHRHPATGGISCPASFLAPKPSSSNHVRRFSNASVRSEASTSTSSGSSSSGSSHIPVSACGSSPDSQISISPASTGPRTPDTEEDRAFGRHSTETVGGKRDWVGVEGYQAEVDV